MSRFRLFLAAAALMLAVPASGARAQDASTAINLTGKWTFTVTTDAGTGSPTVTFAQKGDTLTGHYSSQALGEADLKGTVKDNKVTFSFRTNVQGTALTVTYSGTVESSTSLKGTLDLGGMASGTFTAKKQQ
jgi:hypothetical protein